MKFSATFIMGQFPSSFISRTRPVVMYSSLNKEQLNISVRARGLQTPRKTEFFLSSEMKWPKSGFLLIITGWGESGKVILQVSIAVFSDAVEKFFRANMAQPPPSPRKIGPYAYGFVFFKQKRVLKSFFL